jgi:Domain of unknown function (DUF4926)
MIEEFDTLVLTVEIPEHGLASGSLGAAVLVYPDGSCEVEFVSPSGETLALLTLDPSQFRPLNVARRSSGNPALAADHPHAD